MFWIGLIVGILLSIAAVYGYVRWLMYTVGASLDDMRELGAAGIEAFANRESKLQVWHEDECLFETVFEEE